MGKEAFLANELMQDAAIRNYEVIGEAAKQLPGAVLDLAPHIDWRGIKGFRDILIHAYSTIDIEYLWNVMEADLPALTEAVNSLLERFPVDET
ncbi:MAG: DUF86 domain-containing protein [Planctomycetes bacterium]|nr:DUF86 domain-containing protein [Planctomycetota bacterium]MCW8136512.1 DUF86 domain-containing protein [Planctomycetota bacterium]